MADRSAFTEAEWGLLQFAPLWVYHAVGGSDGNLDQAEWTALRTQILEAEDYRDPLAREVLVSLSEDFDAIDERFTADPRACDEGLADVAAMLNAKLSPEEAEGFKTALVAIAHFIASASGGFFGLNKVSHGEVDAIGLVCGALGVST